MTLDLDYLEDKTRYALSTPTTVISKAELAALVRIARAAKAYSASGIEGDPAHNGLWSALREAGLL